MFQVTGHHVLQMERSFKVNCLALLNIKDSKIPRNTALTLCYILTLVMLDLLTSHNALGLVSAAFAIGLVLRSYFARPRLPHSSKLPPGPALLPILGSALAVDVTAPWLTYKAWGSQYGKLSPRKITISSNQCFPGDVVYTRLFGQDNIIINSERVARDLLDHRSQNYSDRPEIATNELYELVEFSSTLVN